ncbi:similar to Saccharomyces cerevisiae YHR153C SPO16 Meiosis-specific protein involved in synaptonemal complex assembly [Maudiozyma saulgeensis]|uniref:Similar to Saccharomyces cerevisiae YHR153C SPO16 Meiosis-specific protein involved in synaptonemal complex assembly n=1 Tax=Maudiozyma saulgeensis TaxID=1789683 RepID=A0A1X7R4Y9_9SACH|nr:similar to Saccharomyces cerevisiae YHR153C SPO16 Meiosis-specific protein involved in synaptonemal complex assembly [Kazachstania saulgeensis]
MEITRRYKLRRNSHIGCMQDTIVIDINNSNLVLMIEQSVNNGSLDSDTKNKEIREMIQNELMIVLDILAKEIITERNVNINISLFKKGVPLWYWNSILNKVLSENFISLFDHCNFIITLQSNADRQYYQDNSSMLNKFQAAITNEEVPQEEDEENELLIKLALLQICNENNLTDEDIELVITNYHSLEEIINDY